MKISTYLSTLLALPLLAFAQTTENGLSTDACKSLIVIYARGTNEAGNVGEIAGPPFFAQLRSRLGTAKVTVQGVAYSATVAG